MQSLRWYYHRLQSMSPAEVGWRIRRQFRATIDRVLIPAGMYPRPRQALGGRQIPKDFAGLIDGKNHSPEYYKNHFDLEKLTSKANGIVSGYLDFFDLENCWLGDPIDWHKDHSAGIRAPVGYSESIDYRDFQHSGDCKLVWEPNRHHQLVILARAYHITTDQRYAQAVVRQMNQWMDENPFGHGMNWRSPLELGVRLINWVWAFDLIRQSSVVSNEFMQRFLHHVYLHCWEITRKYSPKSSANNHLIGEAAGVYIACTYFDSLNHAEIWREEAKAILCREIELQSYEDGGSREQAFGYQFFVIQFFLFCGWVGSRLGHPFPQEYWDRLHTMMNFVRDTSAAFTQYPMFGDRDDGYVLDLGAAPEDVPSLLSVMSLIYEDTEYAMQAGRFTEFAWWMHGDSGAEQFATHLRTVDVSDGIQSKAFEQSGYYLLHSPGSSNHHSMSLMMDAAELGYGSLAAHGHADALSVVLQVADESILVDPGTYDYFTYPEWRSFFRSTCAHNTVTVDGLDQSELLGPFLWGRRANSSIDEWRPTKSGGLVCARHDGYQRLDDALTHIRSIHMLGENGQIKITDRLECSGKHDISITFQFSPLCEIHHAGNNRFHIRCGAVVLEMKLPESLRTVVYHGDQAGKYGWFSPGYHRKVASYTIVGSHSITGTSEYVTLFSQLQ